jgi:ABC-type multidrug transport system ATPase subunit
MLRVSAAAALAVGGVAALVLALRLDGKDSKGKKKSAAAPTSPTSSSLAAARKYRANSNPESRVNSNCSNNNSNANANNLDTPQQLVYKHAAVDDMHGTSETTCLVFVGMPGRGKTAMAKRTAQYLSFFHGIACQVFSVADRRRAALGYVPEDYYGDDNEEGARMRAR